MSACPKPGIYRDVPWEIYTSWEAARSSILAAFQRSPAHARAAMLQPDEPSPAMALGTALHAAILEPETFERGWVRSIKVDRRTTAGKAAWAEFSGLHFDKSILTEDEYETCLNVRESVWSQPWAEALLASPGVAELSAVWVDPEFDVACKLRCDRLVSQFDGGPVILDVKSARDASPDAFRRSISNYSYHLQMAFYRDGLRAISDHPRRPIWLVIEKTKPFGCALYEPDDETLDEGVRRYKAALGSYADCRRTGRWPGYSPEVQMISLPPWAKSKTYEDEEALL